MTFTIFEGRVLMGVGVYRTSYETDININSRPDIGALKKQIEDEVQRNLGIDKEVARKDPSYSMTLSIHLKPSLGKYVPQEIYILSITESDSITRLPVKFKI